MNINETVERIVQGESADNLVESYLKSETPSDIKELSKLLGAGYRVTEMRDRSDTLVIKVEGDDDDYAIIDKVSGTYEVDVIPNTAFTLPSFKVKSLTEIVRKLKKTINPKKGSW